LSLSALGLVEPAGGWHTPDNKQTP
jgi:hypothetical protein